MPPTTHPPKPADAGSSAAADQASPRTLPPADVDPDAQCIIDVRREADYAASGETLPGATWRNPETVDAWIGALPSTQDVVIYCVRGGGVSNSVVDRLRAAGVRARFIEGGIEAYRAGGGKLVAK